MHTFASSIYCWHARVVGSYKARQPILAMSTSMAFRKGRWVRELLSSYSAGFPREVEKSFIARRPYSKAKDGATDVKSCWGLEDGTTNSKLCAEVDDGTTD